MNIVEKYVQALNYHQLEVAAQLFTEDATMISSTGNPPEIRGKKNILAWLNTLDSEATFVFENVLVEGDWATADFSYLDGENQKGHWEFSLKDGLIQKLNITSHM